MVFNERNTMFDFIKRKIQEWKFGRELKNLQPVIIIERTVSYKDVKAPKKKATKKTIKKKVKKNAKRK